MGGRSAKTPFSSVLVANRGEIALRIMRTARSMGLRTIAVFTDADSDAEYVAFADASVRIGDGPPASSYLAVDRILDAARQTGAAAIHPGYGFLSENADFARAVTDAGLIFVGPPPDAIAAMGNKAEAKRRMIAAGVSCVPGYQGRGQSDKALRDAANKIGYPVMVKAASGGGGRGMRLVSRAGALKSNLADARAEASSAFGSDELILERAFLGPRHVEIQVISDKYGHTIHLGERDCSLQRRHQKVVEEAPSPAVSSRLRARMGRAAVDAANAIGYVGAGTVEFLLTPDGDFYFLEMNTRLQVEHPVTEMVTGTDLVALQFDMAAGQKLPCEQDQITLDGHAIEARLYAEDPENDFLPGAGRIKLYQHPTGTGIRADNGIRSGQVVSAEYDPMLAKIIAHGATREQARLRLIEALQSTAVFGLRTNRDFLIELLSTDAFARNDVSTAFIGDHLSARKVMPAAIRFDLVAIAAALALREMQTRSFRRSLMTDRATLGWGSPGFLESRMKLATGDRQFDIGLRLDRSGELVIRNGDQTALALFRDDDLWLDGRKCHIAAFRMTERHLHLATGSTTVVFYRVTHARSGETAAGEGRVLAPMHGNLVEILVSPGEIVTQGQRMAVLEAMKMRHDLPATASGVVATVNAVAGQQVRAGDPLFDIEMDEGTD